MNLSGQQMQALESVNRWYAQAGDVYRLFGYAGTGKTTLARYIVEALGIDSARYAAFTGKACSVLRSKGADPVSTIHSLIYMPREMTRERIQSLEAELDRAKCARHRDRDHARIRVLRAQVRAERERLSSPRFTLRRPAESILTGSQLLVVDEVSMVDETMARDLMSFGVPILCLGDPAQLPPVDGEGYLINAEPDTLLTEVHRSAWDSPVTRIATTVRETEPGNRGYGVTGGDGESGRFRDVPTSALADFDQVLCGTNVTRWQAIRTLRTMRGRTGRRPEIGDRIIVLRNNGESEVFNGQQFIVDGIGSYGVQYHDLLVTGEDYVNRELRVWSYGFTGPDGESRARSRHWSGETVVATFADAITVHKAQGSQWGSVLVIDESHVFERMERGPLVDRYRAGQRWLYTAVTRASNRVVITGTGVVRDG